MSLQSNQLRFIKLPVLSILREAVAVSSAIGCGIDSYPVYGYIMHSVFLKMTGAQEQKMKCIVWELASNNYEYRYLKYGDRSSYGGCSSYAEKNNIYKDLIDQIVRLDPSFNVGTYLNRTDIIVSVKKEIDDLFLGSNLLRSHTRQYNEYLDIVSNFKDDCIVFIPTIYNKDNDERTIFYKCKKCKNKNLPSCLSSKSIFEIYELLYRHRNRCAHNTTSYQNNLPSFSSLMNPDFRYENDFLRFAVLLFIDDIFIKLFDKYKEVLDSNIY